jgi:glutathione peroxidase
MKLCSISMILFALALNSTVYAQDPCPTTLDVNKRYLASEKTVRLCDEFRGQVLLIVNTASYCGFTPQYEGLEALYEKYRDQGFSVLGFPSNDFFQEPKGEEKVREFCRLTYNVKFPMFEKSRVAKRHADPLFRALAKEVGQYPKWNFYKYLLSREGKVTASYGSSVRPGSDELTSAIESLL